MRDERGEAEGVKRSAPSSDERIRLLIEIEALEGMRSQWGHNWKGVCFHTRGHNPGSGSQIAIGSETGSLKVEPVHYGRERGVGVGVEEVASDI